MSEQVTPDQARAVLEAERQMRLQACKAELEALLDKHGCQIVANPVITQDGRITTQVTIVPA